MRGLTDHGITPDRLAKLRTAAQGARRANYAPYSDFMVLAAVETPRGVFGGSNIENVNYTLTKHAEEMAIVAAIHDGAGPDGDWVKTLYVTSASPCGSCRQFTAEFAGAETIVLIDRLDQETVRNASLPDLDEEYVEAWRLGELLPAAFEAREIG
ncbi:MAG TPA: cytidine deaminase [Solirubrobacterales bacterium]